MQGVTTAVVGNCGVITARSRGFWGDMLEREKLLTLEEAIRKMTSLPAGKM